MNTFEIDKEYIAGTYGRFQIEITGGSGSLLIGADGKRYIDLGSGIAVNTFGMCDKEWQKAVTAQIEKFQHTSNLYYTEPCAELAEMLCARTGMKKVFFSNSGAEANECAIKTARGWAEKTKGAGNYTIITLENSFHGRTLTTLAATGQEHFHHDFLPLTDGFVHARANDFESVKALAVQHNCCAIMMEMVQGEGGVNPLDKQFARDIYKFAQENGLLVIIDEVQTGNGRTGKLYSYENFGIKPDIFTTAKGLGGGLPIGATLIGEKARDVLGAGMHGSTFGGNPICCAGAISILSRLDEELLENVRRKSEYIFGELKGADGVKCISGLGLMIGIEPEYRPAADIIKACIARGVLTLSAKTRVRLLPALNIPDEQLKAAVAILKEEFTKK